MDLLYVCKMAACIYIVLVLGSLAWKGPDFSQPATVCAGGLVLLCAVIVMLWPRKQMHKTKTSEIHKVGGLDELEKLADLEKKGIITKKEFQKKKKKILGL